MNKKPVILSSLLIVFLVYNVSCKKLTNKSGYCVYCERRKGLLLAAKSRLTIAAESRITAPNFRKGLLLVVKRTTAAKSKLTIPNCKKYRSLLQNIVFIGLFCKRDLLF